MGILALFIIVGIWTTKYLLKNQHQFLFIPVELTEYQKHYPNKYIMVIKNNSIFLKLPRWYNHSEMNMFSLKGLGIATKCFSGSKTLEKKSCPMLYQHFFMTGTSITLYQMISNSRSRNITWKQNSSVRARLGSKKRKKVPGMRQDWFVNNKSSAIIKPT